MIRSAVIHAHFYQPPREDPWLDVVEREHSAAPFHDWNTRIEQECYRAVAAARIPAEDGHICRIVNLLRHISFDVGPTLLRWLEHHAPRTYAAILEADRVSAAHLGRGNALAMPYHHLILPLASRRDKVTEVRWGLRDFRDRFGREADGMWLPETAVDGETLEVLAEEGVGFTILAPHQLSPLPPCGRPAWIPLGSGRRIAVFPYDGPISHDVAFGPLIRDAQAWADRMVVPDASEGPSLVAVATDGETFGHHHRFGEMALAKMLDYLPADRVRVENFAAFLDRHPPEAEATLAAPSSWSCAHGVERWQADCGCRTEPGTGQAWRAPLRQALNGLRDRVQGRFDREWRARIGGDPWEARNAHDPAARGEHPDRNELMEMSRHALAMFTSCGWFFDDLAGAETLICLRHAARAVDLMGDDRTEADTAVRTDLARASGNRPEDGTGADLWGRFAVPRQPGPVRAAAGLAAIAALDRAAVPDRLGAFTGVIVDPPPGRVAVRDTRTGRTSAFTVSVTLDGVAHLAVTLTDPSGVAWVLEMQDLPELARDILRQRAQHHLITVAFLEEERQLLADGTRSFAQVLEGAMLRQLGVAGDAPDLEAFRAALDLLSLDARPVPFDVQTRFYRTLSSAPAAARGDLRALAPRVGISPTCTGETDNPTDA